MFERPLDFYAEVSGGTLTLFGLIGVILWGLLMAWIAWKVSGALGFTEKWRKLSAVGAFISFGIGTIVIAARWLYKVIKEKR